MALYLVVHAPRSEDDGAVRAPSRLAELARVSLAEDAAVRWLKTWSPDLHDDRFFSLWEAPSANDIRVALDQFEFLNDLTAEPLRVREWGPDDVLAAEV